ncbi:hypothetical protein WI93_09725 [Burkholderia vietnamiensis]|uniref:beta-galactosidase trimerization domain-containing protein n=1 Tax=Burkholderia vietnamiensis TaxID=60552 RepID=UPI000756F800|nr:beta-galactosidase trimerization domain-containing protein [Burkholderia vietnamiensis]KVE29146.1 hypothetical protein WI93_09725 [Burkholderia vietnamiensis]
MKIISRGLLAAVFAAAAHSSYASETCQSHVISGFVADTFYQDPMALVSSFRVSPFNTIATTVAWSVVEKQRGKIDLSTYYPRLDALTKAGYCIIVLLDTSGRAMRSDLAKLLVKDLNSIPHDSKPGWAAAAAPQSNAIDFFGVESPTFDFTDTAALELVREFYRSVLPPLHRRYGDMLVGVAPCVTSECEIKYSQSGFKWQSYGPKSQQAFRQYLTSHRRPAADLPMMNYGNHLSNGNPRPQPLYPYMQTFREDTLRRYTCALTSEIRRAGAHSIGYFGQTFAFPDGIYATGVIEKTADCFDVAVIDYNFYNGYGVEHKPDIVPFLADYALTLGYKKVLVGTYMERFRNPSTLKVDPRGYDVLNSSLHGVRPDPRILGVEIGNLTGEEFHPLKYVKDEVHRMQQPTLAAPGTRRVAVYASIANSYLWEGEWSNGRQIMQDDLVATYAYLRRLRGVAVDVVSDELVRKGGLSAYQLVVLPHVTAMPEASRTALKDYLAGGGKIIADMRVDEYRSDGAPQTDPSLRAALGIGATQAVSGPIRLAHGVTIRPQRQYVNGFALAPVSGFKVGYRIRGGNGEGLVLRGKDTTVFGFLPLLVEGNRKHWARTQFQHEVARLLK